VGKEYRKPAKATVNENEAGDGEETTHVPSKTKGNLDPGKRFQHTTTKRAGGDPRLTSQVRFKNWRGGGLGGASKLVGTVTEEHECERGGKSFQEFLKRKRASKNTENTVGRGGWKRT